MPAYLPARTLTMVRTCAMCVLPCFALAACGGADVYQYHGRLISYRSRTPLKGTAVYAGPESADSSQQTKTNDAGEFTGSFSLSASPVLPHRARLLDRIDIHYLTPQGWVIVHHALHPEDQDLSRTPAVIDLGTLPVPG